MAHIKAGISYGYYEYGVGGYISGVFACLLE